MEVLVQLGGEVLGELHVGVCDVCVCAGGWRGGGGGGGGGEGEVKTRDIICHVPVLERSHSERDCQA